MRFDDCKNLEDVLKVLDYEYGRSEPEFIFALSQQELYRLIKIIAKEVRK